MVWVGLYELCNGVAWSGWVGMSCVMAWHGLGGSVSDVPILGICPERNLARDHKIEVLSVH